MEQTTIAIPPCVRAVAEKEGSLWVACTLEFGLAAQAESLEEAKRKLGEQLADYVFQIREVSAEDPVFARQLAERRATAGTYLRYMVASLRLKFGSNSATSFREPTPQVLPQAA